MAAKESDIRGWLKERAGLTLAEISARLFEDGMTIKTAARRHQLDKWGLSFKKRYTPARRRTQTPRKSGGSGKPARA